LTYLLLIFNLNSYLLEKNRKPTFEAAVEAADDEIRAIQLEKRTTVGMSSYIILLPFTFLVQYFCIDYKLDESDLDVFDNSWIFYEYQLIPFAVITVACVGVATFFVLKAMDKIFGKMVYPEKFVVKRTSFVMALVVFWRIFGFVVLETAQAKAKNAYMN